MDKLIEDYEEALGRYRKSLIADIENSPHGDSENTLKISREMETIKNEIYNTNNKLIATIIKLRMLNLI